MLPIAEFASNNIKNTSTSYTLFEFYCKYYPGVTFENKINPYLRFCSVNKLAKELKEMMKICCQNLVYI